ncbi:MAG: Na+/H+ antiporter NhaA, partial [Acidobacteria bacterium]|nr:Na+/H+ antiporter NhaA [Acidobacteriota bacterium]
GGFGDVVTSITAPVATGWSDSCRVGFAPTRDLRLSRRTELGFSLPKAVSWKELTAMGFCAAIGFTVSLFIATVAFQEIVSLEEAKMGALASIAAAPLAILLGRIFRISRKRG